MKKFLLINTLTSCMIVAHSYTNINIASSRPFSTRSHDDGKFRLKSTELHSAPPRKRTRKDEESYDRLYSTDEEIRNMLKQDKSQESTFWYSVKNKPPPRQEDVVPYQENLDSDGPLPYGSYKVLGQEEYECKRICSLSIALDFWNTRSINQSEIETSCILHNVHKLIDSGFTSFQLYNSKLEKSKSQNVDMEPSSKQTYIEQNVYHKIVQNTPASVLNQCNFSTRINIPPLIREGNYQSNYDNDGLAFTFRESLVRHYVGQSIKNIYGQNNGCLDSIQVNYQHDEIYNVSPYTYDTLSVLFDMQKEGLIRSISGSNFPLQAMDEMERNGFTLDYNQLSCNLLDPSKYNDYLKYGKMSRSNNKKIVTSSVLAGGLLSGRYSNIPISQLNRDGVPSDTYMSPSESWSYRNELLKTWLPNQQNENSSRYHPLYVFNKKLMRVLEELSYKHQVSIASVALRWSIQLEQVGSVVVSSSLNTKFSNDDRPYTRQRDLRQVFSFCLDEEDVLRLWEVSQADVDGMSNGMGNEHFDNIDLGNTKLWL